MTDVFTKAKRSLVMAKIRGRGNLDTELEFVALLKLYKITGWRRHVSISIGEPNRSRSTHKRVKKRIPKVRPDFVFRAERLAIFIDGCFWHGCPKHAVKPKSNPVFWAEKLSANKTRDRLVTRNLRKRQWKVLRIWEHELRNPASVHVRVKHCLSGSAVP